MNPGTQRSRLSRRPHALDTLRLRGSARRLVAMRIISWNVNGLRACVKKGFLDWLEHTEAEIVALQEVRARPEQLPPEAAAPLGWHTAFTPAQRPGYSGLALYARRRWDHLETSLGEERFDVEGRLQMARFRDLLVVNGYFPNGNGPNRDLSRIPYKLAFYRRLFDLLQDPLEAGDRILVMGDFNTAHTAMDLARPKANEKTSGFRPEERAEFDRWLAAGWRDTFRDRVPEGGHYSWWSQRFGVRERNIGWRIDYVLASPGAAPFVRDAFVCPEIMGSDHCPVGVDIDDAVVGQG